jgi:PAS domain S-box-containing protein
MPVGPGATRPRHRYHRAQAERRVREQADAQPGAEAIFITDLANRVIYWNAGAERLLGWRSDEVLGRTAEEIFDPEVVANIQVAREATLSKGEWSGELRMHNRQHQPLIIESRQTLIRDETGQPKARL